MTLAQGSCACPRCCRGTAPSVVGVSSCAAVHLLKTFDVAPGKTFEGHQNLGWSTKVLDSLSLTTTLSKRGAKKTNGTMANSCSAWVASERVLLGSRPAGTRVVTN